MELMMGVSLWMTCSLGMIVFNKLAITAFPVECSLVALQMAVAVVFLVVFCRSSIHIGSRQDVLRWSMVAPFFTGMLLTSILALKNAPMSLVVTFRAISPLVALIVERFYPNPIRLTGGMFVSMGLMLAGVLIYSAGCDVTHVRAIFWVFLNNFFAIGDRLLQRLMLASDQSPVDISKTGVTLLNNVLGMIPLCFVALFTREYVEVPDAVASLTTSGAILVAVSCIVGIGISYTGVWVQSRINATSFLVLVNANKFFIIFLECYIMHTKQITAIQALGASIAILAGIMYGKAREAAQSQEAEERKALNPKAMKAEA